MRTVDGVVMESSSDCSLGVVNEFRREANCVIASADDAFTAQIKKDARNGWYLKKELIDPRTPTGAIPSTIAIDPRGKPSTDVVERFVASAPPRILKTVR